MLRRLLVHHLYIDLLVILIALYGIAGSGNCCCRCGCVTPSFSGRPQNYHKRHVAFWSGDCYFVVLSIFDLRFAADVKKSIVHNRHEKATQIIYRIRTELDLHVLEMQHMIAKNYKPISLHMPIHRILADFNGSVTFGMAWDPVKSSITQCIACL